MAEIDKWLADHGVELPDTVSVEEFKKKFFDDFRTKEAYNKEQQGRVSAEKERDEFKNTAEKFKDSKPEDYDAIKADYAKLKADAEKRIKDDAAAEQRKAFEADFDRALGERKFVNGFVRKSVMADVLAAREKDQASGISDLIDSVTKDQEGVFSNPQKQDPTPLPTPKGGKEGTKYTRAQIEAMTTDEINANWDDVNKSLAELSKE